MNHVLVSISKLSELCIPPLLKAGISEDDATIVFDHLLDEELLGKHSHGFIRMPSILRTANSLSKPKKTIDEKHGHNITRLVMENTLGLVAGHAVANAVILTAKEYGFGIVSAIGYSGTTGALGYYGRMIAQEGLIGIIACSSEYAVAPWGGKEAILGTNPIAIALPNSDNPIICDFSTAAMTYGELMLAVKEGREVPYGIVLDAEGRPSHNPDDANNGCQLPMAEHKGYALGLSLEVLSGLFIGAKSGKTSVPGTDGIIMLAIKPDTFISEHTYTKNISSLINEIKTSPLAAESSGIRIPGENSIKIIKEGRAAGICSVPASVYQDLL